MFPHQVWYPGSEAIEGPSSTGTRASQSSRDLDDMAMPGKKLKSSRTVRRNPRSNSAGQVSVLEGSDPNPW